MTSFHLPSDLENRLNALAYRTHASPNIYLQQALEEFLDEQEDVLIALSCLEEGGDWIPLDEAKKRLGLLDDE